MYLASKASCNSWFRKEKNHWDYSDTRWTSIFRMYMIQESSHCVSTKLRNYFVFLLFSLSTHWDLMLGNKSYYLMNFIEKREFIIGYKFFKSWKSCCQVFVPNFSDFKVSPSLRDHNPDIEMGSYYIMREVIINNDMWRMSVDSIIIIIFSINIFMMLNLVN